jgi:cytochrome c oxidase cbb3-type subunit 3
MKIDIGFGSKCFVLGVSLFVSSFAYHAAVPAADGSAVFKNNCVMCHGADGKGFPALKTPDFTDPKWQASAKDKEIREVIKNGKKGTMMVGFADKLKDQEVSAVIAYIRSLKKK